MLKRMKDSNINSVSPVTNILLNMVFVALTVMCLAPLILVFIVSITSESSVIKNGYSFFPEEFSSIAYEFIVQDAGQIIRSYGTSILVTVAGTLLSVLIIALYAYPLSRKDFKYGNFFSFIVYFTMLFSGGMVPWYIVYSQMLDLKDTLAVLIIPYLVSPFYVLIMKSFFKNSVPESVIESAKLDGAGEFRIFFSIILRLSTPVLATIGLYNTIHFWNDWYLAMMFISETKLMPLQYLLYRIQSSLEMLIQLSAESGVGMLMQDLPGQTIRMALSIVTIGPIVLAYPFFQRFFIKGLTIGAVKG